MGLSPFHISNSSYDGLAPLVQEVVKKRKPLTNSPPNPNPANFEVLLAQHLGRHLVIKVRYPDCTNYEGEKILVYKNITYKQLMAQGTIDPHFSENKKKLSPFARFEPTDEGWKSARKFVRLVLGDKL